MPSRPPQVESPSPALEAFCWARSTSTGHGAPAAADSAVPRPRRRADHPAALRTSGHHHRRPGRLARRNRHAKRPGPQPPDRGPLGKPRWRMSRALSRPTGHLPVGPPPMARVLGRRVPRPFSGGHHGNARRSERAGMKGNQPPRQISSTFIFFPASGVALASWPPSGGRSPLGHLLRRLSERLPPDGPISAGRGGKGPLTPFSASGQTPMSCLVAERRGPVRMTAVRAALVGRLADCFGCDRYHLYTATRCCEPSRRVRETHRRAPNGISNVWLLPIPLLV